jgi:outer membrane receptor protein involved in Fe transport
VKLRALKKSLSLGLLFALPISAYAQTKPEADGDGDEKTSDIVVTAKRLDAARDAIQPALGANATTLSRATLDVLPGGADRALNSVLLQVPGVSQDTDGDGEVHIRNEHSNVQYRLNGVTIPEGFAGFGPLVDSRIADSIEVITGALPAQYGFHTAGVVQLKTRSGGFDADGDIGIYGGGNGTIQPSATWRNSFGRLNVFVSASYLQSDLGIANPTPAREAIHDRTEQWRGFGYFSYLINDSSRLSLFGGTSIGTYQIPNQPNQTPTYSLFGRTQFDSAELDQNQRNQTHFGVLAYQYSGDKLDVQFAPFVRWTHAHFQPDPSGGELLFNGVDSDLSESSLAYGLQTDASLKLGDSHTVRFGLLFQHERSSNDSVNRVLSIDTAGTRLSDTPISIAVNQRASANNLGVYVQDEWKVGDQLTFNYGLRYDHFWWDVSEGQLSPRASLVWKPAAGTTLHMGYARNFTPPPLALIGTGTLAAFKGTTGEAAVQTADPIRPEREHLFDAGLQQIVGGHLTLGLDAYYKLKRNLLDDTQFGSTQLLAPFNYAKSYSWGVEASASYERGPIEAYVNVARGEQKAKQIVSNQFFFGPDDLDYISRNYIFTDHSQKWTISAGGSLRLKNRLGQLQPSIEAIYGSGLRTGDPKGIVPNGGTEQSYIQVNLGLAQVIGHNLEKALTIRIDVTNLFDTVYRVHGGSGIGAGQPQYGPRRAVFFGIRKAF